MERIGIRALQQHASAVLRRVGAGERLEVTDRGRPVALLVPVGHETALAALEAGGRLIPAEGDLLDLGPPIAAKGGVPTAVQRARQVMRRIHLVRVDDALLDAAAALDGRILRSLAALHLAAAHLVASELEGVVTYDRRLAAAAAGRGFAVLAPA